MGDSLQAGKASWYVTSHPGQLSLAIPPWVGAVSTSESWDVNRHTALCTSPVSVVWQCKLVSGWGLRKRRSAPPYGVGLMAREGLYVYFTYYKILLIFNVTRSVDLRFTCLLLYLLSFYLRYVTYTVSAVSICKLKLCHDDILDIFERHSFRFRLRVRVCTGQ